MADIEQVRVALAEAAEQSDAKAARSNIADATREVRLLLRTITAAQLHATARLKSLG